MGTLRGGCLIGFASPVLMECCTNVVLPRSPESLANKSSYFLYKSCSPFETFGESDSRLHVSSNNS